MRIGFVIQTLNPGGAERVATLLANAWARGGHEVTLFTFEPPGTPPHYPLLPEVRLRQLDLLRSGGGFLRSNLQRLRRLRGALAEAGCDLLVSFMVEANVASILVARWMGVPVVVSERIHPGHHPIGRLRDRLRRWTYPRADAVVVQTAGIAAWMEADMGVRCEVFPNPVSPAAIAGEADFRFPHSHNLVAAGRLTHQKGFDLLIEAFARVAERFPGWGLTIFGEGEERQHLEAEVGRLGLAGRVRLPGVVERLPDALRAAELFVHPARYEGFPNVLMEALAVGLPAIASDSPGGAGEILQGGRFGVLVPVEDASALAAAMGEMMASDERRRHFAGIAPRAVEPFALEAVAGLWLSLFARVLDDRHGKSAPTGQR